MVKMLICNLFHRHMWLGIRDFERMGIKPTKAVHCLICDGEIERKDENNDF